MYSRPRLSWVGTLKMIKINLELLTDIDKLLTVEKGIRGGIYLSVSGYKLTDKYKNNYDGCNYYMSLCKSNLYDEPLSQVDSKYIQLC